MKQVFSPRLYQETIFSTATRKNTLVVLPTGLGKTAISLMLAKHRLTIYPDSKVLVLAPTKPLVEQHFTTFSEFIDVNMSIFTGEVSPIKREALWNDSKIIFSTPQGLENDIISSRIDIKNVSLIVFDEAHKATGDYSYKFIAEQYQNLARFPKILALTASPGAELETITEVCQNLFIEDIEIRTEEDPDVKPYVQDVKIEWVSVKFPENFKEVRSYLDKCYKSKLIEIKNFGFLDASKINSMTKTDLLRLQGHLQGEIASANKSMEVLRSLSLCAEGMKVQHAIELLETQGIAQLKSYMLKLQSDGAASSSKAAKNLICDLNFKSALIKIDSIQGDHPKFDELRRIVKNEVALNRKIIIFTQFRESGSKIVCDLNAIDGADAKLFVGQAKKNGSGLSQKEQKKMLDEFRVGNFNILVATSVAEEGLDIPKVDTVIFYEPIPSAIRTIQRRGRTGRLDEGKVIVLMTLDTRDVGYKWSSHHKEKKMYRTLEILKKKMIFSPREKENLNKYIFPGVKILVDYREKASNVIKDLMNLGVNISLEKLEVGDYVLSHRCCVEYKTVPDFVDSIIDGRLMEQVKNLKQNYQRPLIIVEGIEDIYSQRNIHPNAIRGVIGAITVSFGVPIIFTKTNLDTASQISVIAKKEQEDISKDFSAHGEKRNGTLQEAQEYLVSSLPGVGPRLAKLLLDHFKTPLRVMNASTEELAAVEGMGIKRAMRLKEVVGSL